MIKVGEKDSMDSDQVIFTAAKKALLHASGVCTSDS